MSRKQKNEKICCYKSSKELFTVKHFIIEPSKHFFFKWSILRLYFRKFRISFWYKVTEWYKLGDLPSCRKYIVTYLDYSVLESRGLSGVTRGGIGMNVSWGRSLQHTRAWDRTRTCVGCVCRDDNPANARLNHCHLTDWPVSVVLVKKSPADSSHLDFFVPGWTFIYILLRKYRNHGTSDARSREKFNSSLQEFEEIMSFHREYTD